MGQTTRPEFWPMWWALFCASLHSMLTSSHGLLFPEKITWQNFLVRLTSGRPLKFKNMEIYFIVLKPNERGLFRKSRESMENVSRSS
jgi:hypothetical protein